MIHGVICQLWRLSTGGAHDSLPGWDLMQAMSAIEIEHRRCSQLTSWMGFDAGNVSNWNRAQEALMTHCLDGIWCRQCQQLKSNTEGAHNSPSGWDLMQAMSAIEIEHRRCSQLTVWMGFDAGNVSKRNRAQETLATHHLDGIWCGQCQQTKSSTGDARNSPSGWDLMRAMSAIEIKLRRCSRLTGWMGFDAGNVSNWNQAQEVLVTHHLDGIWCRQCQQLKSSTGGAHDSLSGWDLMQAMSAIEIEHRRCSWLTIWMGFDAGNVSNWNRAQEVLTTHCLDGIWCRHCQQSKSSTGGAHDSLSGWDLMQAMSAIEIEHRRCSRLTIWMGFDAGNVSNRNRAQEALATHSLDGIWCRHCQQLRSSTGGTRDSLSGWDLMQALSAIEIKHRRRSRLTPLMGFDAGNVSNWDQAQKALTTHWLDGIWCRQCQQLKSSTEVLTTHHLDGICCRQCQQLKSSTGGAHNSLSGWDLMQALSAIEIEHRRRSRLTPLMGFDAGNVSNWDQAQEALTTHHLDGIWCRQCQQLKSSTGGAHDSPSGWDLMQALSAIEIEHRRCSRLTIWMGFDAGNVSNRNRAQEVLTTHRLDGIWCRQCQQSKSSTEGAHDSLPGWDLMQAMSAIEIEHRRCSQLTIWMGFDAGNVSNRNRAQEVLTTHRLDGIWCRQCQQSKSSTEGAHDSLPGWDLMQALSAIEIEHRRRSRLTLWIGFDAGNVSRADNPPYYLLITSCTQYSDIALLLIPFLPCFPLYLLIR